MALRLFLASALRRMGVKVVSPATTRIDSSLHFMNR
jgi:hypothetical protein